MNPNEAQPKNLRSLLEPAPEEKLIITPASPSANSVKNDSLSCSTKVSELVDNCGCSSHSLLCEGLNF